MTDREYLETVHITRLQSAARLAGLRWKSGDPAYNKAGIIAKLEQYPNTIMAACLSALRRMEAGDPVILPKPASSFADDIADDLGAATVAPISGKPAAPVNFDLSPLTSAIETLPPRVFQLEGITSANCNAIETLDLRMGQAERNIRNVQSNAEATERRISAHAINLDALANEVESLRKQAPVQFVIKGIETPIVQGQHSLFPRLVQYLSTPLHRVMLTGPASSGKSRAVRQAADTLGVKFHLIAAASMAHELIGHTDAHGVFHHTALTRAYVEGGLCLVDEADSYDAQALLAANAIFDGNGFAAFGDGNLYQQHPEFYIVLNTNTNGNGGTLEYAGRVRLDGATQSRFPLRIQWTIDAPIEQGMALGQDAWLSVIHAVRKFIAERGIVDVNATTRHTQAGAYLLALGTIPKAQVLHDTLCHGAVGAAWDDVLRLPVVRQWLNT